MATEIERKYLVTSDEWKLGAQGTRLVQGYLSRDPDRTVRVRLRGEAAFLTVKGPTSGISRTEIELPISLADAEALLQLCLQPLIEKTRHVIIHDGMTWEVDEFHGLNAGLILAEIEIPSESTPISLPDWIGAEVTRDFRYANSSLAGHPFCDWAKEGADSARE